MIKILVVRFLKARWGSILPAIFKAAAEGQFGDKVKFLYWKASEFKTFTGAILWAVGAGADTVCGNYPDFPWACTVAKVAYYAGMFLTGVGLADGGTRAPWPKGADIPAEAKR